MLRKSNIKTPEQAWRGRGVEGSPIMRSVMSILRPIAVILVGGSVITNPGVASAAGSITVSPIADFSQVIVGQTAGQLFNVHLDPGSTDAVTISSVSISGENASDFAITQDGCSGVTLSRFGTFSCQGSVAFTPSDLGTRTATLSIFSDAAGSPHQAPLTGTGGPLPDACGLPGDLDFGFTPIGNTGGPPEPLLLRNCGLVDLHVSNVTISGPDAGDFSFAQNTCTGATLPPFVNPVLDRCAMVPAFTPTAEGNRTATLEIFDDAPDSPQQVTLTGFGVPVADVGVGLVAEPDPVLPRHVLEYRITLHNSGPSDTPSVTTFQWLPTRTAFIDVKPRTGCTTPAIGDTGLVICDIGPLAVGADAVLKVEVGVTARPKTSLHSTVFINSPVLDFNSANNSAESIIQVGVVNRSESRH